MRPKPTHLGAEYGAQFQDASVVAAYPHRPPYPEAVFETLAGLLPAGQGAVLDLGCGTGDLARRLAERVARVDALDLSAGMLALARTLPGGDRPNLRWIHGAAEAAPLEPPYGLITAGESLHWMRWEVALPRCRALLAPGAVLAIVEREEVPRPWFAGLVLLFQQYSTNKDFQPYNVIHELTTRGLFAVRGQRTTEPVSVTQSIESYIESIHSRNGFSRERMAPGAATAFDDGVRALLARAYPSGQVSIEVRAHLTWGQPGG
ncbi:MAG TPA: class I SAM-dependent methyltransferase [Ktedonobacterales bacterium]